MTKSNRPRETCPRNPTRLMVARIVLLAWVTIWLLWLVALYAFAPHPAHADTYANGSYFVLIEDAEPQDSWFARIKIRNIQGSDNRMETIATQHGDVVIAYETTPGITPESQPDADQACVTLLPEQVIAAPPCVTVSEADSENIYLLLFTGG